MRQKIVSCLFYGVPVLFFIIAYFLIITSGEDIFQGASSNPDIIGDALAAFEHSARLSDMYAWAIINFFDYRFSFGVDAIFRLIDVAAAFGIFYLLTDFILGRRPKLALKDSLVFCLSFIIVILTPFGRPLYSGFSMIHNYLLLAAVTLIFLAPFVRYFQNRPVPNQWWFKALMLVIGFIFGTTSNITPLAALLTAAVLFIGYIIKHKKVAWRKLLTSWGFLGLIGAALGVVFCNLFSTGVDSLASNAFYINSYDYLTFAQIFTDPFGSLATIFSHLAYNFGLFCLPLAIVFLIILILKYATEKTLKFKFSVQTKHALILLASFTFFYLLAVTQIKCPARLLLPAYLTGTAFTLTFFYDWLKNLKNSTLFKTLSALILIAALAIVCIRTIFAIDYQNKTNQIIENIKNPEITEFCIDRETTKPLKIPYLFLTQEDMIAFWDPVITNNTTITYCP